MPEDEAPLSVVLSQFSALQGAVAGLQTELDEMRAKKDQQGALAAPAITREEIAGMISAAIAKIKINAATPLRASGSGYNITLTCEQQRGITTGQAVCNGDGTITFTFQ